MPVWKTDEKKPQCENILFIKSQHFKIWKQTALGQFFSSWRKLWNKELRCICRRSEGLQILLLWHSRPFRSPGGGSNPGQWSASPSRKPNGQNRPERLVYFSRSSSWIKFNLLGLLYNWSRLDILALKNKTRRGGGGAMYCLLSSKLLWSDRDAS